MSAENVPEHPLSPEAYYSGVGQVEIEVSGASPDKQVLSELTVSQPWFQDSIRKTLEERFEPLVNKVISGEVVAVGFFKKHKTITITVFSAAVATALGIEIVRRHGEDIKQMLPFLNPEENRKDPLK